MGVMQMSVIILLFFILNPVVFIFKHHLDRESKQSTFQKGVR